MTINFILYIIDGKITKHGTKLGSNNLTTAVNFVLLFEELFQIRISQSIYLFFFFFIILNRFHNLFDNDKYYLSNLALHDIVLS